MNSKSLLRGDAGKFEAGRRGFVGGVLSVSAGLAGSMLLPDTSAAQTGAGTPAERTSRVFSSDELTVTETAQGKVRGARRNGVFSFKGLPYGASTSGERRFMAPAKPEPWTGIRNALQYGRVCPNRDSAHFVTDGHNLANSDEDEYLLHRGANASVMGEDCLRVNVWTPEINGSHKRPVMVFMHGGGFSGGNAHELLAYNGESLARNHDVVVVTHNHRLNVFGYLNLDGAGGEEFAQSANVGMLDLVAVLEWVRENIANFGGDAGNVTIFGQSGGGGKVLTLMAMPAAKGLFHRVISQSGPYLRALTPDYSAQLAGLVLKELGLTKAQVRELQKVSVDRLFGASVEALRKMPDDSSGSLRRLFGSTGWGPTVDGLVLPQHPFHPGAPALSSSVPLMTGSNLNEFVNGVGHPELNGMSEAEMVKRVDDGLHGDTNAIIDAYRREYPGATPFNLYATIAASSVRQAVFEQARRKAALGGAPAYSYIYSWRTPTLDDRPGSFHAAELAFVFDNGAICDHYSTLSPASLALSHQMSSAWVSFARTGDPNHAGMPHWAAYSDEKRTVMDFNTESRVRVDPEGEGLKLVNQPV